MSRYFNADKMLKEYQERLCFNVLCSLCPFLDNIKDDTCQVEKWINEQPTADVQPVVKGEWIEDGYNDEPCVCSNCGHPEPIKARFLYSYCPNCGADLRGGAKK